MNVFFTCKKRNGNSVIDYLLRSECILDRIHKFLFGKKTLESNHRALCIDLKCQNRFDCEKAIEDNKQLNLNMNLKRVHIFPSWLRIYYKRQTYNMVPPKNANGKVI